MSGDREAVFGDKPWPQHYTFVPAVRVGDILWLSGMTGTDDSGQITAPNDIEEQTRQIFRKFVWIFARKIYRSVCRNCSSSAPAQYQQIPQFQRLRSGLRIALFIPQEEKPWNIAL